jgi:hypothetical protein
LRVAPSKRSRADARRRRVLSAHLLFLTLCFFVGLVVGHVEIECVGFSRVCGFDSGVPSITTRFLAWKVPMFVSLRAGILQSFWRAGWAWLRVVLFRGKHTFFEIITVFFR